MLQTNLEPLLEDARIAFYCGDLPRSYSLFRRGYDRLPFAFDSAHARYIGPFARLLWELGREEELRFYQKEFERWMEEFPRAEQKYALAVCYLFLGDQQLDKAKDLLEEVLKKRGAELEPFIQRARAMLVYYHSRRNELGKCLSHLSSLKESRDKILKHLVDIWEINILRRQGEVALSTKKAERLLLDLKDTGYWYLVLIARLELSRNYCDLGQFQKSEQNLKTLTTALKKRSLKRLGSEAQFLRGYLRMAEQARDSQSRMWI